MISSLRWRWQSSDSKAPRSWSLRMGFYLCLTLRQMTGQGLVLATAWTVWSRTSCHSDHFHSLPLMEKQWERKVFSNPWTNTPLFLESAHSALVQQVLQDSFWESPSCKPLPIVCHLLPSQPSCSTWHTATQWMSTARQNWMSIPALLLTVLGAFDASFNLSKFDSLICKVGLMSLLFWRGGEN